MDHHREYAAHTRGQRSRRNFECDTRNNLLFTWDEGVRMLLRSDGGVKRCSRVKPSKRLRSPGGRNRGMKITWGKLFAVTQPSTDLWPPGSVSELPAREQELFAVQILGRCWMSAVSQLTKPFENKVAR